MVGGSAGGGYEVGYGFCLGKVEFAVEEGSLCVFSWVCCACSVLYEEIEDGRTVGSGQITSILDDIK